MSEMDLLALEFLKRHGPHTVGLVDDDEKFAAAFVFLSLQKRGHVIAGIGEDGPAFRITPKGVAALHREGVLA
ncbi:hypothetical protein ACSMXM_05600 [Pacificimonas sp. ICDLI1SI03]